MTRHSLIFLACFLSVAYSATAQEMELFDHNGSQIMVEYKYGTMRYAFPKESLRGIIDRYQVVFTGDIQRRGKVSGVAYVYKRGCPWAEYPVSGGYDYSIPGYVLTGSAPVRQRGGCKVVGYKRNSSNARLVFVDLVEQEAQLKNQAAKTIVDDESGRDWGAGFLDGDGKVGKQP